MLKIRPKGTSRHSVNRIWELNIKVVDVINLGVSLNSTVIIEYLVKFLLHWTIGLMTSQTAEM